MRRLCLFLLCCLAFYGPALIPLPAFADEPPLTLTDYLARVIASDPDVQLAHAKVREARARQQNVVKKRFLNLFNFINAENLLGSAESDLHAAEARAQADTQTALLEAGLMALDWAGAQVDAWAQMDAMLLAQRQLAAAQLQFNAGKTTRYQLDAAQAEWLKAQQAFRTQSQLVTDKRLKLSANVLTASQLERPQPAPLSSPDLIQPDAPLDWAPVSQTGPDCSVALNQAVRLRPELTEFLYRQDALNRLIRLSKVSQRPVLLANQQQLLLKKQKFERTLAIEVASACTGRDALAAALPAMQAAASRARQDLTTADQDMTAGRISRLDWQTIQRQWVLAHQAWRQSELQLAQANWRLRYLTGQLQPAQLIPGLNTAALSADAASPSRRR